LVSLTLQPLYFLVERLQYPVRDWMGPIINLTSFDKQIVLFFLLEFKSLIVHPTA